MVGGLGMGIWNWISMLVIVFYAILHCQLIKETQNVNIKLKGTRFANQTPPR